MYPHETEIWERSLMENPIETAANLLVLLILLLFLDKRY